jgi:hypothetical protein
LAIELISNDITTALAAAITGVGDTSITVVSATGFPTTGNFRIRIGDEVMLVTDPTGGGGLTWTVERGKEDTTATTHLISASVSQVLTKQGLGNLLGQAAQNVVMNGAFHVWQRGTSFAAAASETYTADGWNYNKSGAMVHTITQSTTVPTVDQAGFVVPFSLKVDCTTVDAAIAAGDYCFMLQTIEGYDFLALAQRPFTISFWVRATKIGTYCVTVRNAGADRSYVAEYTVATTDTWELKTITGPASPSAGTWNYANGGGLYVIFTLACGSTYQTTPSAWQTGNFVGTANQVNACDDTANDFHLALVKAEPGDVATPYYPESIAAVLARCQRYYEVHGVGGTGNRFFHGGYASAAAQELEWTERFAANKGGTPTITVNGTWTLTNATMSADSPSQDAYRFRLISAAAGIARAFSDSADDTITAEWNP